MVALTSPRWGAKIASNYPLLILAAIYIPHVLRCRTS
jgi:hypothetical protein